MHNRSLLFIGIWILLGCFCSLPVHAAPRLDAAFGLNGRVAVELGVKNSAHAVVVQPDGKIVVAGSSSKDAALNFSLLRFNRDGSLDPTFHGDGSIVTSVSKGDDEALALGLLPDGRIVAAGYSHNGTDRDFALVCYLPDGSRDLTFGHHGAVVTRIGNGNEEITAMTINSAGMITVAGAAEGTKGRVLVTARYFADGVLDNSYGERGVSIIGVGEGSSAEGIIERKDGSLVVSGTYVEKQVSSLMLVGLDPFGFIDYGFGTKGVAVSFGSFAACEGYGLAEDADGHLYLAGSVGGEGKRDTALFRFTRTGKADTSFGDKGVIVTPVSEQDDVLYAVNVGKRGVVASGYTTDAGTRQFLLVTFSEDSSAPASVNTKTASTPPLERGGAETSVIPTVPKDGTKSPVIPTIQKSGTKIAPLPTIKKVKKGKAKTASVPTIQKGKTKTSPIRAINKRKIKAAAVRTIKKGATKAPPIQEIRVNGGTKVQIRRMRLSSSLSDFITLWYPLSFPPSPEMFFMAPVQTRDRHLPGDGPSSPSPWISSAIKRIGDFLVPPAAAADTGSSTVTKVTVTPQFVTTTFSEGESVSYAATLDGSGNIIVVGSADGAGASSIVVAQYTDEMTIDRIVDQPGYRSSHIATTPSADITRTTAVITGEITPIFGRTVIRRGMVFSVGKDPVYSGSTGPEDQGSSSTTFFPWKLFDGLSEALVARAVAATVDVNPAAASDFIEKGETVNGSGYGTFSVCLSKLKPGTTYFARTYALTSEGAVYYGNQLQFRTADACFVATASFGTLLHPGVDILRDFRDTFLVHTPVGQRLVAWYYTLSPPVADVIARNELLRSVVRLILLPFIGFSWLALQLGMVWALLTFVGSVTIIGWLSSRVGGVRARR